MTLEEQLDRRHAAMIRRDEKAFERMCAQRDAAESMIGERVIEGRATCYINLKPLSRGRIKTGTRDELIDFLIRNRYFSV